MEFDSTTHGKEDDRKSKLGVWTVALYNHAAFTNMKSSSYRNPLSESAAIGAKPGLKN